MSVTERYVHYHRDGNATARLELVFPDEKAFGEGEFMRGHADALRSGFEADVAGAADAEFDAMRSRGRAYRYRMCVVRAVYAAEKTRRGCEVTVTVSCASGRRVIYAEKETHILRRYRGEIFYAGSRTASGNGKKRRRARGTSEGENASGKRRKTRGGEKS